MKPLPFDIPPSLAIYLKTFEEEPKKGISMLEALSKKRRNDPIVHFLLAFFYHDRKDVKNAFRHAGKAAGLAPGSPLMRHVRYFLTHPDGFEAWVPDITPVRQSSGINPMNDRHFDLDMLINRLSSAGKKKITLSPDAPPDDKDLSKESANTGGLATNTLAVIYEKQGKIAEAIEVYEKMRLKKPEKADVYEAELVRLRGLNK